MKPGRSMNSGDENVDDDENDGNDYIIIFYLFV
jgi:hypothetical protein